MVEREEEARGAGEVGRGEGKGGHTKKSSQIIREFRFLEVDKGASIQVHGLHLVVIPPFVKINFPLARLSLFPDAYPIPLVWPQTIFQKRPLPRGGHEKPVSEEGRRMKDWRNRNRRK